jgi:hypothetical protein
MTAEELFLEKFGNKLPQESWVIKFAEEYAEMKVAGALVIAKVDAMNIEGPNLEDYFKAQQKQLEDFLMPDISKEDKVIKVFLDDYRIPKDCLPYMFDRIGVHATNYHDDWLIVKNYPEFIKAIDEHKGNISHISFDHDLADGHYHKNMQSGVLNYDTYDFNSDDYNKTGYHCAKYMKQVYEENKLDFPFMYVHSMNPVGTQNIINLFKNA